MHIHGYPTVFAIGHKAIEGIFNDPVIVEEKVDGSQFSMCIEDDGTLSMRSKGTDIYADNPEKMFSKAVQTAKELAPFLQPGWVYRCEYLSKPKHNTLAYDRAPQKYLILFDVETGLSTYMLAPEKKAEADRIGLECVPLLFQGVISDQEQFKQLLETQSILGGQKIEGVVVKNYQLFTAEKKVAMGKYVSEAFKEVHGKEWKKSNPTQGDIVQQLIDQYRTPARWNKAIQHIRERGELEGSPRDIGNLMKEVQVDTKKECEQEIKDFLFEHFWKNIARGITSGLPEWYKEELLKNSFTSTESKGDST